MKIEGGVGTVVAKPSITVAKIAPWASLCATYMTGISINDSKDAVSNSLGIANSSFRSYLNLNNLQTNGVLQVTFSDSVELVRD
jgi:hypothetical protein